MSEGTSGLLALYNGLTERLGSEIADALMTYLPTAPTGELATKGGILRLEDLIQRVDERLDRQQHTMVAGFVALASAMVALAAAIVVAGFLA